MPLRLQRQTGLVVEFSACKAGQYAREYEGESRCLSRCLMFEVHINFLSSSSVLLRSAIHKHILQYCRIWSSHACLHSSDGTFGQRKPAGDVRSLLCGTCRIILVSTAGMPSCPPTHHAAAAAAQVQAIVDGDAFSAHSRCKPPRPRASHVSE